MASFADTVFQFCQGDAGFTTIGLLDLEFSLNIEFFYLVGLQVMLHTEFCVNQRGIIK